MSLPYKIEILLRIHISLKSHKNIELSVIPNKKIKYIKFNLTLV